MSRPSRGQKFAFMKEIISDEDKLAYYLLLLSSFAGLRPDESYIKRFPYNVEWYMDQIKEEEDKRRGGQLMTDDMRSVANKAITEASAMMNTLVSDGSIDQQTYYDLMGEFEETMLPEEDN